jgi:hypothetical protein
MSMLLLDRFNWRKPAGWSDSCESGSSSSICASMPLYQPRPNSYGFARGDPLTLSKFSSFLGSRTAVLLFLGGNDGVLGGRRGLKFEFEGSTFLDTCILTGECGR